jgi:ABC-type nitrate/sulfonate/bicarbonate transport system substrate-binding protein
MSKTLLALVLATIVVAGCAIAPMQPAAPPKPTAAKSGTMHFFDISNLDMRDVPMLIALDALRAEGYTVETTYLANSTLIVDALARGDADAAVVNNQSVWLAASKGAAIRTIAEFTGQTTSFVVVQGIASCTELAGKRVGLASKTGLSPTLLEQYLKRACPGVAPVFMIIPDSGGRLAGLLAGELDASLLPGEEFAALKQRAPGRFTALMTYSEEFPAIQIDGIQVRKEWAEQNAQMVRDYLRAVLTAYRQVVTDPEILYAEGARRLELSAVDAKSAADYHLANKTWHPNGGISAADVQTTISLLADLGLLPKSSTVNDVVDLSHLNAVLDEIGRK